VLLNKMPATAQFAVAAWLSYDKLAARFNKKPNH
jgi:hypothetical protein